MKTVHIVGNGSGREKAPTEGDVWLMNGGIMERGGSRLFLMDAHAQQDAERMVGLQKYREKAKERNVPVWSVYKPMADRIYPAIAIAHTFGSVSSSGSFDWCMALAIFECYEQINIYGVHLTEGIYRNMKPYGDAWVTTAQALDIEVTGYQIGE